MRRKLRNDDLLQIHWVRDPQIAPDGESVAYVESWLDSASDKELSAVRVVRMDGDVVLNLTKTGTRFECPRWSPDGTELAFLSDADGTMQLWVADAGNGVISRLSEFGEIPVELDWSPDGNELAVAVECVDQVAGDPGYMVDELPYKIDGSPLPARRSLSIYLVNRCEHRIELLQLGGQQVWHPRWRPIGRALAFLKAETRLGQICDVWLLDRVAGGELVRVTDCGGPVRTFIWSPGGDELVYVGHRHGEATDRNQSLWRTSLDEDAPVNLTKKLDRSVGMPVRSDDPRGTSAVLAWSKVTDRVYFEVAEGGCGPIRWVDGDGRTGSLFGARTVALSPSACMQRPRVAAIVTTSTSPGEIVVADELSGELRQVSLANPWLSDVELPETELIQTSAADGVTLEGWLVHERSANARSPRPLVVSVHGGPHYAVGWRFNFEHLRLASKGYAVLSGNPRGSLGYGEEFALGIRGSWGDQDWLDLSGLIERVAHHPLVDNARMAITGVSYGGFMAQWAICRTGEFRAAISENGISNFLALWGTTRQPGVTEIEFGGAPWASNTECYVQRSPLRHADTIGTPLLLIHADADQICPVEQSEQMYAALKRLGQKVHFVRLTAEGHLMNLVGRPSRRLLRASVVDNWLARYLQED